MAIGHYVPQLHLRYFTSNPNECRQKRASCRIHSFDKHTSMCFSSPIAKAGGQRNFYVLEKDQQEDFEKFLQKQEDYSAEAYKRVCELKRVNGLEQKDKERLAVFLSLQDLRTPNTRESLAQSAQRIYDLPPNTPLPQNAVGSYVQQSALASISQLKIIMQEVLEGSEENKNTLLNLISSIETELINGKYPKFLHGRQVEDENAKEMHLEHILRNMNYITSQLMKMQWILLINPANKPFWTSDNPLVNLLFHNIHLPTLGQEIRLFFPLNVNLGIGFAAPNAYNDTRSRTIAKDDVLLLNRLQIMQSERYIFSNINDFQVARQILTVEPELAKPYQGRYGPFQNLHLDSTTSI